MRSSHAYGHYFALSGQYSWRCLAAWVEKHGPYTSARQGLVYIHADAGRGWATGGGDEAWGQKLGASEMCPQLLKICPQMCPQMPPDCGTLPWTLAHFELRSTEGEKKKAGRLCTFAALNLVPPTGIEPDTGRNRRKTTGWAYSFWCKNAVYFSLFRHSCPRVLRKCNCPIFGAPPLCRRGRSSASTRDRTFLQNGPSASQPRRA